MLESETKRILIVDDCSSLRNLARHLIKSVHTGYEIFTARNAEEALEILNEEEISLVLTDCQMPGMNGLELLQLIGQKYPAIPVIVMTAFEDDQVGLVTLLAGAAGFLRKSRLAQELPSRLQAILSTSSDAKLRSCKQALSYVQDHSTHFLIPNDRSLIPEIIVFCQELLAEFKICNRQDQIRVGIALEEAIINGMIHGNLEVGSELRGVDDPAHCRLIEQRMNETFYASRQLSLHIHMTSNLVRYVVRDEGPGFDYKSLSDPTDPKNLMRASGRGMLLIRSFMDELQYNEAGNEITIVKYKTTPDRAISSLANIAQEKSANSAQLQDA